ncbi:alpha/beta hydrolase [Campylobacter sp. 2018MI34]|uniref:alpha/beta hydrolase n=1 Tax=Campylobacter sp. 2018MI34 TaxID=2800582 RepID=UPI001FEEAB94|nr:alpha/beta hydrolase [Campylobacter sp. 2018MI34]
MQRRDFLKTSSMVALGTLAIDSNLLAKENTQEKTNKLFLNPSEEALRNVSKNPFGLVYENAIAKNQKGWVNIKKVSYGTKNNKSVANLYLPANFNAKLKYPAIVVAHPNGGVKEQVAGLFAQKLAELGYITLAFDAFYQGESQGFPRNKDIPSSRVEDISKAIDFLDTFKGVDKERIGILGICGGGGYTLKAAQKDKRLKAVATLSAFNTGLVRRNGFLNSELDKIQEKLLNASKARELEAISGKISYTGFAPKKLSKEELDKIPTDLYREGMIYYGDTHAHPNSSFIYTTSSLMELMSFDATDQIELINQPLLMLVGDKADTAYMSKEAFDKAIGTQNKKLYTINNATHIQTYYKKEAVDESLNKLKSFYEKNLKNLA